MTRIICGVDIASSSLEARIGRQGAFTSFANNAAGIAALATFCRAHQVELVAMEATGGYEQQAFALLAERDLPVAILNPRAVRNFAQSMGRLEKTDAIDAGMIAWYAAVRTPPSASGSSNWPASCSGRRAGCPINSPACRPAPCSKPPPMRPRKVSRPSPKS